MEEERKIRGEKEMRGGKAERRRLEEEGQGGGEKGGEKRVDSVKGSPAPYYRASLQEHWRKESSKY